MRVSSWGTTLLFASTSSSLLLDDTVINAVNSNPDSTWTAARNPRFEGVSLSEAKLMLGAIDNSEPLGLANANVEEEGNLGRSPVNFDSRDQWPGCIHPIRDQGQLLFSTK
jgi:cathepsin B